MNREQLFHRVLLLLVPIYKRNLIIFLIYNVKSFWLCLAMRHPASLFVTHIQKVNFIFKLILKVWDFKQCLYMSGQAQKICDSPTKMSFLYLYWYGIWNGKPSITRVLLSDCFKENRMTKRSTNFTKCPILDPFWANTSKSGISASIRLSFLGLRIM